MFAWEEVFLSEACQRKRLTFGWTGNAHLLSKTSTSTHCVPILTVTAVSFCWPLEFHKFTSKNIQIFICRQRWKETRYLYSSTVRKLPATLRYLHFILHFFSTLQWKVSCISKKKRANIMEIIIMLNQYSQFSIWHNYMWLRGHFAVDIVLSLLIL